MIADIIPYLDGYNGLFAVLCIFAVCNVVATIVLVGRLECFAIDFHKFKKFFKNKFGDNK